MDLGTHHGSSERISFAVTITHGDTPHHSTASRLFGEDEQSAREHFKMRARTLRRGRGDSIALERTVRVESWIQRTDQLEQLTKPVEP